MKLLQRLTEQKLIHPPKWLPSNVFYATLFGSVAYGCSSDTSDCDVYGFAIPPKEDLFPWLKGEIPGFGKRTNRFEQWSEHHIEDKGSEKQYDFTIFSIVKFFQLCMEGNPNMLDAMFTPINCVIHSTAIGELVREHRRKFLHKGCYHKFRGYAFAQLHKMGTKTPEEGSKRYDDIQKTGYDSKFGYHLVRLLDECEQILTTGDMDIQRSREVFKAIRRGEWTEQQVRDFFALKEKQLETVYNESNFPYGPDEAEIKKLLCQCLEMHYGSLDKVLVVKTDTQEILRKISELCEEGLRCSQDLTDNLVELKGEK